MTAGLEWELWKQLLRRLVGLWRPCWALQRELVNAGLGSGKDSELEAEVWALKAGGGLMEAWLRLAGSRHRPKGASPLLENLGSWNQLHLTGAGILCQISAALQFVIFAEPTELYCFSRHLCCQGFLQSVL